MTYNQLMAAIDVHIRLKLLRDGEYGRYQSKAAAIKGFRTRCRKLTSTESSIEWVLRESRLGKDLPWKPSPSVPLLASDIANGQRFVRQNGQNVRYDAAAERWLNWEEKPGYRNGQWVDGDHVAIEAMAKATGMTVYDESKAENDPRLAMWAKHSQSAAGMHAMLEMAHSEPDVVIRTPDLNRDPWLLNTHNGTIDLHTGERRPAERGDLITKSAATWYAPDAKCPRWLQFLDEIFIHADFTTDQDLIDYMQRLAGYSLTGSVREAVFSVLYGTGGNGKTVWMNIIRGLLGDYAGTTGSDLLLSKRTDAHPVGLAALSGYRLIHATETDASRRLDEATVKNITGGDPITARWMHGNPFTFEPQFKLMLATNHKPDIKGTDDGIWRRIHPIPFRRTIDPDKVDRGLESKLRDEWPGILAWAVRGCLDWQAGGLRPPAAVVEAAAIYRQESDAVRRFIEDRCECLHGAQIAAGQLFAAYRDWCEREGEQHLSSTAFGRELSNRGCPGDQARISTVSVKIRRNIRLSSED